MTRHTFSGRLTHTRLDAFWSHATLHDSGAPPTGESQILRFALEDQPGHSVGVHLSTDPNVQTNETVPWADPDRVALAHALARAALTGSGMGATAEWAHSGSNAPLLSLKLDTHPGEPLPPAAPPTIPTIPTLPIIVDESGSWQADRYFVHLWRPSADAPFSSILGLAGSCSDFSPYGPCSPFGYTERLTLLLVTDDDPGLRSSWIGVHEGRVQLVHQAGPATLSAALAAGPGPHRYTSFSRVADGLRYGRLLNIAFPHAR